MRFKRSPGRHRVAQRSHDQLHGAEKGAVAHVGCARVQVVGRAVAEAGGAASGLRALCSRVCVSDGGRAGLCVPEE